MRVSEIFESIDGEGIRVGYPVTFIRLFGCNLRCSYCDSRYACEGNDYTEMDIADVVDKVIDFGHNKVTLTGGEPLIHRDVKYLIKELLDRGYELNIETDGAVPLYNIGPMTKANCKRCIITLDYKCPSSGMEDKMLISNFEMLTKNDVLKFVVGSDEDLKRAKQVIEENQLAGKCNIYFSPVFGNIEGKQIVEFLLENKMDYARVQLQLHKFIWNPEMRGV